jgi:hypothetical protein
VRYSDGGEISDHDRWPWLFRIEGDRGSIAPYGAHHLEVSLKHKGAARELKNYPDAKPLGTDVFEVPADMFETVCKITRAAPAPAPRPAR